MTVLRPLFALVALTLLAPTSALACGGLFCSSATLQAVDQAKERILFEVRDGEVITHVEIRYAGNPREFSWVVPVPATPDLEVVPPSTLRLLDIATAPSLIPPNVDNTDRWDDFGWPAGDDDDDDDAADDDDATGDPVDVEDLPVVGAYDPEVVSSDDPEALADWLTDNGYLITDGMRPLIAAYVEAGMKFLGMKLVPGSGAQDISPIRMSWPGDTPSIPLRLTAVGAEPGMQLAVFFIGDTTWEPRDWGVVRPDNEVLRADPRTAFNNYYPWLAREFDDFGGRAFALEYAISSGQVGSRVGSTFLSTSDREEAEEYLDSRLDEGAWFTRLYTSIDPAEMLDDPTFAPTSSREEVVRVHDLRDQEAVYWDFAENPSVPCGTLYCGAMGQCAVTADEFEGCACDPGSVARTVEVPWLGVMDTSSVACVDATFDPMGELPELAGDPCDGYSCGAGACLVVSGKATCECDAGFAAVPMGAGLSCEPIVDRYTARQLDWPCFPRQPNDPWCWDGRVLPGMGDAGEMADEANACSGCSAGGGSAGLFGLLMLVGVVRRRV